MSDVVSSPYYTRSIYKLGYVKRGSTAYKVQKDGCGVPSAARTLLKSVRVHLAYGSDGRSFFVEYS